MAQAGGHVTLDTASGDRWYKMDWDNREEIQVTEPQGLVDCKGQRQT